MTHPSLGSEGLRVREVDLDPSQEGVSIVETHVSRLVFRGDRVHKRKKAVRFEFVDLSTAERRERMCRREVALNSRLSPDVYLGVEDVIDDTGQVVDHAVLMVRMPDRRRLAELVRSGRDVSELIDRIARVMATFHASANRSAEISSVATPNALHQLWELSLSDLAHFVPRVLDPSVFRVVDELAHKYIAGRAPLLAERIASGRIVDGHGDLLADDIFCLVDGPRILDCLEFDDRLRWGDTLLDVAFLAMDLERLRHLELALDFLSRYRRYAGDSYPLSLQHHYIAYRSLVRAKVSCLKKTASDEREAVTYFNQCIDHLQRAAIHLVVVGGLPGTGKSTLAGAIGERTGWRVLRSDAVRKELAGMHPDEHRPSSFGNGLYDPAVTGAVYDELMHRAETSLEHGESVVLDASFSDEARRRLGRGLASRTSSRLTELQCAVPAAVADARLDERAARGDDASDATSSMSTEFAASFDDWPQALLIDTLPAIGEVVDTALGRIRSA